MKQISIKPPPGVTFTQFADGSITLNYAPQSTIALREAIIKAANTLFEELLKDLQAEKEAADRLREIPTSPSQVLARKIEELRASHSVVNADDALISLIGKTEKNSQH